MFLQTDDKLVVISALAVICATTWTLVPSNLTRRAAMQQVDAGRQDLLPAAAAPQKFALFPGVFNNSLISVSVCVTWRH